ncbi:HEAT repeat domain-containing protein [Pseudonocardia abyssalis]|jgi:HEAT repeat protein|uniref:HEAT repeat domain-containing protein n=1 Tax=Pseudonocardia abyssalis TaxID=2792008 RepID=A0ABS6UXD9_9PSEU|nr:HEAT repeat domain-containing protein [Pseudonocardia abyssalis]MBW0114087.1 HEAT repeat domain-containing protein [Pseudonocardia abyssalis]MBW0136646.1 HEAT repeat domain-containing protein [Pseudonocardia abyssalis]
MVDGRASGRLQAALRAGTSPAPGQIDGLVARCAVESDFFVRDMLTWALTRHDPALVVPRLVAALRSDLPQARSQALHTLSKIGDVGAWPAITVELLTDDDDEVARTAWRTAVGLVPDGGGPGLAEILSTQFGRGGREVRRSLSRAFVELGEVALPVVRRAMTSRDPEVRAHAAATERMLGC